MDYGAGLVPVNVTSWVGHSIVPVHGVVFYRGMFLEPITPPLIHILGVFSTC
jgi:hypothetical protein